MDDGIIDKLMIAIELDPSKYEEGRKKLSRAFKDTADEARRSGQKVEESGKMLNRFFDEATDRALKLGTVLLGGVGMGEFIGKSIQSGSALGYMSKNIGVTSKDLFKFQTAVRLVGGDADQVAPALLGLSQALATIQLRGKGSEDLISAFQFLGITDFIDHATGKVKNVAQLLPEIQRGLSDTAQKFGAPIAYNLGKTLGLTDDLINLFLSPEAKQYLDRAAQVSEVNDRQTKSFQRLVAEWGVFKGALTGVGYDLAGQLTEATDDIAEGWDKAGKALQDFINQHSTLKAAVEELEKDPWFKKAAKLADKEKPFLESDIGAAVGGTIGAAVGSAVFPVVGTAVGATLGVAIGGTLGAADARRRASKRNENAGLPPPEAPAPAAGPTPEKVFSIIQSIEGGKRDTVTPTHKPTDPYAYGKNQITLGTALQHDRSATIKKLLDPEYNDWLARKIEAKYFEKYKGDLDAISVAYNAGPGAAERYLKAGKNASAAGLPAETIAYLDKERRLASAPTTNSTSTSTTHIGSIHVNAPNAKDAATIAKEIRGELSQYQLLSQGNAGPQ